MRRIIYIIIIALAVLGTVGAVTAEAQEVGPYQVIGLDGAMIQRLGWMSLSAIVAGLILLGVATYMNVSGRKKYNRWER